VGTVLCLPLRFTAVCRIQHESGNTPVLFGVVVYRFIGVAMEDNDVVRDSCFSKPVPQVHEVLGFNRALVISGMHVFPQAVTIDDSQYVEL
jgi:hypothetical protein